MPQNVRKACTLPDSDKWLVVEDEEMESIRYNTTIAQTVSFLHDGIIGITTMFIYALRWTLMDTIERHKTRGVVRSLLHIPDF